MAHQYLSISFVSLPSHWKVGKNKASFLRPSHGLGHEVLLFPFYEYGITSPYLPMWHDIYQCHPDGTTCFANPPGKLYATRLYNWNGAISWALVRHATEARPG